jgi:succinyl-CoA synthetase alpha subunit
VTILANAETRILVQGITGREAATFTGESLTYGARIVAGVTPGKGGMVVHDVPVYDTVRAAVDAHPVEATIISVPPQFALDAALEAMSNGIRLLVVVTERIPRRDVVTMLDHAARCGARIVGPNTLGIISPEQTRVGMAGGSAEAARRAYTSGSVGVVSRSGGMMTEIANLLTQAGIGQSTCVSIGGDPIVGSTILDLMPLYEADPHTAAVVMFCEPGGTMEERLAAYIERHQPQLPVIAFVAGRFADQMQGVRFGHAGAIVQGAQGSPAVKIARMREAGILVANKLYEIPDLVRAALRRAKGP